MKKIKLFLICLLTGTILGACGSSQATLDAKVPQIAAESLATQTVEALMPISHPSSGFQSVGDLLIAAGLLLAAVAVIVVVGGILWWLWSGRGVKKSALPGDKPLPAKPSRRLLLPTAVIGCGGLLVVTVIVALALFLLIGQRGVDLNDIVSISAMSTPTPTVGIGVPIVSEGWQVTIEDARHETEVTRSSFDGRSISVSTTTPGPGFTFLVVETTFRNLDPLAQTEDSATNVTGRISVEDVTITGKNGQSYEAHDDLSEPPGEFVFTIEEDAINQVFELHFRDAPLIPFSVEQEAVYPFSTEIGAEPGPLPYTCKAKDLTSLDEGGRLAFSQPEEAGLAVGYVNPDGSDLTPVCSDIAFGDLQLAADGATLLLVTPQQGWSSLYLIEPEGEIYPLVSNGLDIETCFDPSGRWILFATERVSETDRELYTFDRETKSTNLVKEGHQISFDFLIDGRLIVNYRETEESDRQSYVGPADGSTLELLDIPEDIPGNRSVSADGQHVVYFDLDSLFNFYLFISELDGNNAQELVQAPRSWLNGLLSPDGQSILVSIIGIGEGTEAGNSVEFHNLTTGEILTVATGMGRANFDFSSDGQWASVVTTVGNQHTLYIVHTADGSIQEINDAVNAFFSPDSTQLAYTVRQPDGNLEMYVTSLDGETEKALGPGMVTGWFPLGQ